jgi:predicted membrane protein (TIGR00267 family)
MRNKIENHFIDQIKQIVFGVQDGLVSIIVLTTTLAGITSNNTLIIISALSAGFGGAISMAAGIYIGSKSQKEMLEAKINNADINAEGEIILENHGIDKEDSENIISTISKYDKGKDRIIPNLIVGQDVEEGLNPYEESISMGLSFIFGAIIPIIPYLFLKGNYAVILSIVLTAMVLFLIGVIKAKFANIKALTSGFEIMIIGMIAGAIGYILGIIL